MKTGQIRSHAGLRGVAALLVVAYHFQFGAGEHLAFETATPFFRRSYLMVDLFFLLSGFIISYVNDGDRRSSVSAGEYRDFIARRLIRLYPLLLFSLVGYLAYRLLITALIHAAHGHMHIDWSMKSLEILGSQALLLYAWLPLPSGWNVPSWSISAEMFAYLLFPFLVTLHAKWPRTALCLLGAIALTFYGAIAMTTGVLDIITVIAPFRCIAGFSLGMLLYYSRNLIVRLPALPLAMLQLIATAAALFMLARTVNDVLIIPAFAIVVGTSWTDRGPVARLLGLPLFVYLGDISYSVYLNHVPVKDAVTFIWTRAIHLGNPQLDRALQLIVCTAAILLISHLTFRRIEIPARHYLSQKLLKRRERPIELSPPAP